MIDLQWNFTFSFVCDGAGIYVRNRRRQRRRTSIANEFTKTVKIFAFSIFNPKINALDRLDEHSNTHTQSYTLSAPSE